MRLIKTVALAAFTLIMASSDLAWAEPPTLDSAKHMSRLISLPTERLGVHRGSQYHRSTDSGRSIIEVHEVDSPEDVSRYVIREEKTLAILPGGKKATLLFACGNGWDDEQVIEADDRIGQGFVCFPHTSFWLVLGPDGTLLKGDNIFEGDVQAVDIFGAQQLSLMFVDEGCTEREGGEHATEGKTLVHVFGDELVTLLEIDTVSFSEVDIVSAYCYEYQYRHGQLVQLKRGNRPEWVALHFYEPKSSWQRTHWRFNPETQALAIVSNRSERPKVSRTRNCQYESY